MIFTDEQKQLFERAAAGMGCCASWIEDAVRSATETFAVNFIELADIGRRMNRAIMGAAEDSWLETHSRLPGSNRTKRLRKKRETMLMKNMFQ